MRIDFSQLDKEDENASPQKTQINNKLLTFWGKSQEDDRLSKVRHEASPVKFSVSYPYEVSRSLSPDGISKEISYLKSKQILPASTLNYIQASINKNIDSPFQVYETQSKANQSPSRNGHNLYFEKTRSKSKSKGQSPNKNKSPVSKKHTKKKPTIGMRSHQRAQEKAEKIKNMTQQILISRQQKQLRELTLQPVLNYTMNSKIAKKVQQKRKNHFNATNSSVFESLYSDAARYTAKRHIERIKADQAKPKKQQKKTRVHVFSNFQERLQRSLEASAQRKMEAQNKQVVDPSTGRKMFVPDTHLSKLTYYSHFKSSYSISQLPQDSIQARAEHYSKESAKLNRSHQQITTTLNYSLGEISQMNRRCEGKPDLVSTIPGKRQQRLAELYADLIWRDGRLHRENLCQAQDKVLAGFIHNLRDINYSATVNRQVFMTLFKDYIGKMNLFDKDILIRRLKHQQNSLKTSRTQLNSSFQAIKPRASNIVAPDHQHKFFYV